MFDGLRAAADTARGRLISRNGSRPPVWIGEAHVTLTAGQFAVPAGRKHGFANNGTTTLRIQSTLAEPVFEAAYDDKRETPRRWLPA